MANDTGVAAIPTGSATHDTHQPEQPERPETSGKASREAHYLLCALVAPGPGQADVATHGTQHLSEERLLACCRAITARVELVSLGGWTGALLDVGHCTADEARCVSMRLRTWLRREEWRVGIGIAPSLTLAELAALSLALRSSRRGDAPDALGAVDVCDALAGDSFEATSLVTPEMAEAWARGLPVWLLARLDPARALPLPVVERLRRYGLRTLGQVARLEARDPLALRRQFGTGPGSQLTALCHGDDLLPIRPVKPLAQIALRQAFAQPIPLEEGRAALDALAQRLARRLSASDTQGRHLRLRITWESGAVAQAQRRFARPLCAPDELARAARALLSTTLPTTLTTPRAGVSSHPDWQETPAPHVTALALALGDLSPWLPARPQPLFTLPGMVKDEQAQQARRERATRLARLVVEVGEPLARRYGAPALYRLATTQPDAILPEERTCLIRFAAHPDDGVAGGDAAALEQRAGAASTGIVTRSIGSTRATRPGGSALRGLGQRGEASGVVPPQPHWW